MAFALAGTLTFSADQVILTDTSGDYDVSSNPTGYGTPNPEFDSWAHYGLITKKNVNEVADVVLTLDAFNPISDSEFTAARDVDGWYEGTILNIPIWDYVPATAYTGGTVLTGSVVYDLGIVYYCTVSNTSARPASNPSKWTVVTDLSTIATNPSVTAKIIGQVTAYNADVYWSKQIATLSEQGQCGVCEDDKLKARLDKIYRYIQNVLVADQLGNDTDGEWNALQLIAMGAV